MVGIRRVLLAASLDAIGTSRMPKLLARAGLDVTLLSPAGIAAARSKYISEHVLSRAGPDEVARNLRAHLESRKYDWIIAADEPLLWAAAALTDSDWLQSWFPVALDQYAVELLTSKIAFLTASAGIGLPVPAFELCRNGVGILDAADRVGYPVFIKAIQGLAGSGLRFATDKDSLKSQLGSFPETSPLMVQESIDGASGSIAALYDHGRAVCWFGYIMKQTWPNRFASASVLETFNHPDIELLVNGIGKLTGFHGFSGIDWVHDRRSERLKLLEFNPRPTPVFYAGPAAGVDFSQALKDLIAGLTRVQRPAAGEGRVVLLFPQNLYRSIEGKRPWDIVKTFRDAPWDEPVLLAAHLRRVATHYFVPASLKRVLKRGQSRVAGAV